MTSEMMQAVFYRQYGAAEVLEAGALPVPEVGADSVRVRVVAAGVNPADAVIRRGDLKVFTGRNFPKIPGNDLAGVVDAVGANVTRFKVGDAVYAMTRNTEGGAYAQYAVVDASAVARIPAPLTFGEAAAVPLAALTALQGLRDQIGVNPGMAILINGASGGVGSFAVQMAKAMGARVTAASSGRNADFVRGLGADAVVDYTQTDVTQGGSFDAVFDAVGVHPFARWKGALRNNGVVVTVNPLLGNPVAVLRSRFDRDGRRLKSLLVKPSGADLEGIAAWIGDGRVRPHIEARYSLAQAADAHRQIESQRTRGKLIVVVDAAQVDQVANALLMKEVQ